MLPRPPMSLFVAWIFLWSTVLGSQKPNIILMLLDDAGWRDFEGHDELMRTPNILKLRSENVFLNQSYVATMCSPTRAALLTGRYSHTIGVQDGMVFRDNKRLSWLNENLTILPQELQKQGYQTHMTGKWHMGYCHPGLTPLGRGFDTFYGFYTGGHLSYYNHTRQFTQKTLAYDWWDGSTSDWSAKGLYQTDILNSRAVKIIKESDSSRPFFLYQAWGAPHSPFQCPRSYQEAYCSHITDSDRKTFCCMMAIVDKGVGDIVQALKNKSIYNNTVILLLSDNGGPSKGGSSNWPLRGSKKNVYEGGIRAYTILKVPGYNQKNTVWSGLVHVVDWVPTLIRLAGGRKPSYADGFNLWPAIRKNLKGPRKSFLMIDDFRDFNHTVFRSYKWKLIQLAPGLSNTSRWTAGYKPGWYPPYHLVNNGSAHVISMRSPKLGASEYQLFNLDKDPYEKNDLSQNATNHTLRVVKTLRARLEEQLKHYPLLPFPTHFQDGQHTLKNGALASNWCQPAGLQ